ncbi:unnamed protein product [Pieris brassicae]|uniref:Uncharacterized protein n=1 Tax=Pieris brassicae TaxID=7116 RepID=A0A9P0T190_PIEBR|nr:unnamed protein product [Pieris brassicae]
MQLDNKGLISKTDRSAKFQLGSDIYSVAERVLNPKQNERIYFSLVLCWQHNGYKEQRVSVTRHYKFTSGYCDEYCSACAARSAAKLGEHAAMLAVAICCILVLLLVFIILIIVVGQNVEAKTGS